MEFSRPKYWKWVVFPFSRGFSQNSGLPHCKWILYQLSHKGNLVIDEGMDFEARKYNLGLDLEGDFWETGSGNEKCNVYKN